MRRLWIGLAVATLMAAGGCQREEEPPVASAADGPKAAPSATGGPSAAAGSPAAIADPRRAGQAFVRCVRERGQEIIDPPDPDDPRSAIRHELDVNGKGDNMDFQAALDACLPILPAPPPRDAEQTREDIAVDEALRAYTRCLRANGLPDYPDLADSPDLSAGPVVRWQRPEAIPEVPPEVQRKCREEMEKLDAAQEEAVRTALRRR
jgi:hypothetical protein